MLHIVLGCIRQESKNKWYRNTLKDLLLPNTVNQKDEKPYTAGLNDTAIAHIKIKITEIPLEKKAKYRNTVNPMSLSVMVIDAYRVGIPMVFSNAKQAFMPLLNTDVINCIITANPKAERCVDQ